MTEATAHLADIPDERLILLDSNIVAHLLTDSALGREIHARYALGARSTKLLISVLTLGELHRVTRRRSVAPVHADLSRMGSLAFDRIAEAFTVRDDLSGDLADRFGEIAADLDDALERVSDVSKIWIAATAAADGAVLVTDDTDFQRMERHIELRVIRAELPQRMGIAPSEPGSSEPRAPDQGGP